MAAASLRCRWPANSPRRRDASCRNCEVGTERVCPDTRTPEVATDEYTDGVLCRCRSSFVPKWTGGMKKGDDAFRHNLIKKWVEI